MYRKRNVPADPKDLPQYLNQELTNIEAAQNGPFPFVSLQKLTVAPTKVWEGMTVLADGTNWNPGAGAGVYCYYGAAWAKLG